MASVGAKFEHRYSEQDPHRKISWPGDDGRDVWTVRDGETADDSTLKLTPPPERALPTRRERHGSGIRATRPSAGSGVRASLALLISLYIGRAIRFLKLT
jgi:hypothetical protein